MPTKYFQIQLHVYNVYEYFIMHLITLIIHHYISIMHIDFQYSTTIITGVIALLPFFAKSKTLHKKIVYVVYCQRKCLNSESNLAHTLQIRYLNRLTSWPKTKFKRSVRNPRYNSSVRVSRVLKKHIKNGQISILRPGLFQNMAAIDYNGTCV